MRYLIASVLNQGQCSSWFTVSLLETALYFINSETEIRPILFDGKGSDPMLINQAITIASKQEMDGLFLIGPDCGWKPETLEKMLDIKKEVVAAPVWNGGTYDLKLGELSRLQRDEENGAIKVLESSLDFFFLGKKAIADLCRSHPLIGYEGNEVNLILQSGDIYKSYHTNEAILAYRLRELGYEIWLHPYVKTIRTTKQALWSSFGEALDEELAKQ